MSTLFKTAVVLTALSLIVPFAIAQTYPNSMAVLGDSISRATLADGSLGGLDYGQPEYSWATGDKPNDAVLSHYERILAANSGISGNNHNLAKSGARMSAIPGQALNAVNTGVEYVVIQIGGNDLCRDDASQMTPTATFLSQFQTAMDTLQNGLPDATIVYTETVRVKRVYDVGKNNFGCQTAWYTFQWCNSALLNGSTQRAQVDARNIEYNNVTRTECAARGIPFDDDVFEWAFSRSNLSSVDCFHPSRSGQHALASITYDASRF
jgi:lysophospholipase L1-like esterase